MESLKAWAKSIYLVAIVSSVAILMIPKSMQKQSKFVIELLLLLAILAPIAGFVNKSYDVPQVIWEYQDLDSGYVPLSIFYIKEIQRQVTQLAVAAGLPVHSVMVKAGGLPPDFSGSGITLYLNEPVNEQDQHVMDQFSELLASRFSISAERILYDRVQPEDD